MDLVPQNWQDRVALPGIRAEAWVTDTFQGDLPRMATFYHQQQPAGKVALVLGAGNVASLPSGDFLHKLFVERQVVLFKANPVNAYLGELLEQGFRALVEPGYLQIVYGGAEVGAYLAEQSRVDEVHLTGSDRTYEAVVFGRGEQGRANKHKHAPITQKRVTAELGSISPVIVLPSQWSRRDIRKQAAKYATALVANSGFNCITPRLFITMKGWPQREEFIQAVSDYLKRVPPRKAYYPGANRLHTIFAGQHPEAQQIGEAQDGQLPWTFIPKLDAANDGDICFHTEPFLGLFSETSLDAVSAEDFLTKAVDFANQKVWGNLCASIVVHPKLLKDPLMAAAVDRAITDLKYGSVVVNHWGALAYYMAIAPWGAYPGNAPDDIQSGIGKVHNPLMFADAQKSVLWAPFISIPDPYVAASRRSYRYYRQDTRYQHNPSLINLVKLLWAAALS